jgi:hypothetical protein
MTLHEYQLGELSKTCRVGKGDNSTGDMLQAIPPFDTNTANEQTAEENCNILKVRIMASEPEDMPYHKQILQYPLAINEAFVLQQE